MKTIIINSPLFREKNERYDEDALPPIGLGLIATALKNNGIDVSLIDAVANRIPLNDLINTLNTEKPAYIGINVFTTNLELVKELVETISFDTHFVIGALSTHALYQQIFDWNTGNAIDVVHGDGELIFPAIVSNNLHERPAVERTNRRFYQVDSKSTYFVSDISDDSLDRSFFVNEPTQHPFGFSEANIITSRGCIYNCAFCAAAKSLNRQFGIREKNVDSIAREIGHLIDIYPGLESIRVLDDLFLKNRECVVKAIEVFKKFNLRWRSMAHVQTFRGVDEDMIKELRQSGCDELFIGIESGSPEILKQIHKTHDVEVIKDNLSKLLRYGINIKGYFIYGFPNETLSDMAMTFELAQYLKDESLKYGSKFRTSVFQFRPYHGTELYHSLKETHGESTFDKVSSIEPDNTLSDLVGRLQFNFHSGNHSNANIDVVRDFIYKTTNLNSARIFSLHDEYTEYFKKNRAV